MEHIKLNTGVGQLAANLYLPEGVENPPVVIVTGAWTTVKEQMPAVYAQALADKGYAAVTFDFRGWGQSVDSVRYFENPSRKTEDIRAVIDAVAELDQVDGKRIGGLGICASAGYMLDAVAGNDKVKAATVVAPWLHDQAMATAIYGGEESVKGLLAASEQAASSDVPVHIEAASTTNEASLMYQAPYYTETDRGLIPEYDNQFNVASWDGWLNYDAQLSAAKQDKPIMMVASEAMALPAGAHQYLGKAGANVQATWLEDISQFDFYDQPEAVSQAVDIVVKHFESSL
ncbi:alpha/beta hydrolase [Photobacterium sp. BZF1]|uniref:alpha/beta hydrolase n=1 Tax=Photobacterium sp. BZF1 TaxID=1904457 RepID=UPI0016538929|nr:alpha/beta hydrolase [Photobacterium sp. BZF1]MBC7002998.1 alpha/beta hydrolase [Photobacterium sp. BZF1]